MPESGHHRARFSRVRRAVGRFSLVSRFATDGREIGKTSRTYSASIAQNAVA
jgi:hypothetical protein